MLVRITDNVGYSRQRRQFFGSALRIATGDDDSSQGVLAVNSANGSAGILVCRGRDRASIQNNDFRVRGRRRAFQSAFFELPLNASAIGLGRAATKILYVKTCHGTIVAAQTGPKATGRARTLTWVRRCLLRQFGHSFPASHLDFRGFLTMQRRVLLVDDDATVLLTLKAVLELNCFEVDTATSASEARDKLLTHEYDIVITDVHMETEDAGFEVLRTAHAQRYHPATAILTAYPPQDERWRKEPVESFLVKPIATRQLVQQLETLLTRHANTEPPRPGENAL
jgi:CheY-like chemotaxis protein